MPSSWYSPIFSHPTQGNLSKVSPDCCVCASCYSETSLIQTSNIHLLGLHGLSHCAFYLTLMAGREQNSYARSFEGRSSHAKIRNFDHPKPEQAKIWWLFAQTVDSVTKNKIPEHMSRYFTSSGLALVLLPDKLGSTVLPSINTANQET